jgi:23S rRNA (cytidine2498-2'-O)-methyltransferase
LNETVAARFLFVCCQPGAEGALKNELAAAHPAWRFAFSRPGFATFKWSGSGQPAERLQLRSVFARTYGWSLGPLSGSDDEQRIAHLRKQLAELQLDQLHVWRRESRHVSSGLPRQVTPSTEEFGQRALAALIADGRLAATAQCNQPADRGQVVGDLIEIDSDKWWLGWHRALAFCHHWPGGVPLIAEPPEMVSRAYLKMREALLWSALPIQPGDRCVEIGSAPGGASQALLESGMHVMGVDPAIMDSRVLANPHFMHIRKRGADVKRRDYAGNKWLVVDANIGPRPMLDMVEDIVSHPATRLQGMLLTLKLPDWKLAGEIAEHARRVRSWGFEDVRCRQLASNHLEVCLAALRSRSLRRRRVRARQSSQAARK